MKEVRRETIYCCRSSDEDALLTKPGVLSGRIMQFFIRSDDLDSKRAISCWEPDQGYLQTRATSRLSGVPGCIKQ